MIACSEREHDAAPAVPDIRGGSKRASRTLANGTSYEVQVDALIIDEWGGLANQFDDLWWRRDSERNSDIYRAVVGAVVHESSLHRGHYLTLTLRSIPMLRERKRAICYIRYWR